MDHALTRAAGLVITTSSVSRAFARLYETNGLSASEKAIALVSAQRPDGRWFSGTNDVTSAAVDTLRRLIGEVPGK